MSIKKKVSVLLSLTLLAGLAVGCGSSSSNTSSGTSQSSSTETASAASQSENTTADSTESSKEGNAEIIAKFSATFPGSGTQYEGISKLAEFVNKDSNGRIEVQIYPSSQLGDKIAAMEGMISGTIEMSEFAATDFSNYDDMWSVLSLPYMWDSEDQAIGTLTDEEVRDYMEKNAEQYGMMIIAWQNLGMRSILNSKREVKEPKDLNGLTIRCMQDPILANSINAMGASATPMAWSEVYTALQQGTIDGLENSAPVILANGMQEVAKYFSLTEQFSIPDPVVISKSWYDGLSKEDQDAIIQAGEEYTEWYNSELWPGAEDEAMAQLKDAGVTITEPDKDAFKEATQSVVDDFISSATDQQKEFYDLLTSKRDQYK